MFVITCPSTNTVWTAHHPNMVGAYFLGRRLNEYICVYYDGINSNTILIELDLDISVIIKRCSDVLSKNKIKESTNA